MAKKGTPCSRTANTVRSFANTVCSFNVKRSQNREQRRWKLRTRPLKTANTESRKKRTRKVEKRKKVVTYMMERRKKRKRYDLIYVRAKLFDIILNREKTIFSGFFKKPEISTSKIQIFAPFSQNDTALYCRFVQSLHFTTIFIENGVKNGEEIEVFWRS